MIYFLIAASLTCNMLTLFITIGMSFKLHRVEHEGLVNHYMIHEFHREWKEKEAQNG